jgi:hypothetical protein
MDLKSGDSAIQVTYLHYFTKLASSTSTARRGLKKGVGGVNTNLPQFCEYAVKNGLIFIHQLPKPCPAAIVSPQNHPQCQTLPSPASTTHVLVTFDVLAAIVLIVTATEMAKTKQIAVQS